MKIRLAYPPEEEMKAVMITADLLRKYPRLKVDKIDREPPFLHTYLSTKMSGKPCDPKKNP